MIQPPEPISTGFRPARDAKSGPVTCAACGCRLERSDVDPATWFHFGRFAGRDARGCRVGCVEVAHDRFGLPALAIPA